MTEEEKVEEFGIDGATMIDINHTWGASFEDMKDSYIKFRDSYRKQYKTDIYFAIFQLVLLTTCILIPLLMGGEYNIYNGISISIIFGIVLLAFRSVIKSRKLYLEFQSKLDNKARG